MIYAICIRIKQYNSSEFVDFVVIQKYRKFTCVIIIFGLHLQISKTAASRLF